MLNRALCRRFSAVLVTNLEDFRGFDVTCIRSYRGRTVAPAAARVCLVAKACPQCEDAPIDVGGKWRKSVPLIPGVVVANVAPGSGGVALGRREADVYTWNYSAQ